MKAVKYWVAVGLILCGVIYSMVFANTRSLTTISTHQLTKEWRMVLNFSGTSPLISAGHCNLLFSAMQSLRQGLLGGEALAKIAT